MLPTQTAAVTYKENVYVVQSGDSLYEIAERHDTTVQAIKRNNSLDSEDLLAGHLIYLPKGADRSTNPLSVIVPNARLLVGDYVFPIDANSSYERFWNTYGDDRTWTESSSGQARNHEGIDIMTPIGTPIYSVSDGYINRIGWNPYGGWRVNITDLTGKINLYYAHLEGFTPVLRQGDRVESGQVIGFVGDSGYGPAGTTGLFDPHLHFGMYHADTQKSLNPFYYLTHWEQ